MQLSEEGNLPWAGILPKTINPEEPAQKSEDLLPNCTDLILVSAAKGLSRFPSPPLSVSQVRQQPAKKVMLQEEENSEQ